MRSRSRPLSPLVDSSVNDVLLQTVPDINKALLIQLSAVFIRLSYTYSLLRNTTDFIIHWN